MRQRSCTEQEEGTMGPLATHWKTKAWTLEGAEPAGPLNGIKRRNMFSRMEQAAICMEERKRESSRKKRQKVREREREKSWGKRQTE